MGVGRLARGLVSGRPLDAAVRVAGSVIERLEEKPIRVTPLQQLLLGAAAANLRAAASSIIVSGERHRADSPESALGEIVSRTLALVDAALSVEERSIGPSDERASAPLALKAAE